MIGEELVPGLPETRGPEERPSGDAEAVAADLVVSAVRPLAVRRYERAERPAPAVVAGVLKVRAASAAEVRGRSMQVVLYSESLGEATRFRLLGPGRRARFGAPVETPRLERTVPELREFGGHLVELRQERPKGRLPGDQLIGVGGVRGRAPPGGGRRTSGCLWADRPTAITQLRSAHGLESMRPWGESLHKAAGAADRLADAWGRRGRRPGRLRGDGCGARRCGHTGGERARLGWCAQRRRRVGLPAGRTRSRLTGGMGGQCRLGSREQRGVGARDPSTGALPGAARR
jgi:hypothetical protein